MTESARWTRVDDGCFELDLLTASYRQHAFTRHSHTTFAIGVVTRGEEQFHYRGGLHRAGVGSLAILEPDEPHDGMSADERGWTYRVLYPSEAMLFDGRLLDGATAGGSARPAFPDPIVDDPRTVHLIRSAHEELTAGADPLAAHSKLAWAFEALIQRHGTPGRGAGAGGAGAAAGPGSPPRAPRAGDAAAARKVAEIRDRLMADLRCPPSLRELAAGVELSPFHMLRVFRDATGFPPHAWLVLERVCRARHLLTAGQSPAQVAGAVGFADQAHLTRWFKRVTGVTPAVFRNSVQDPRRRSA